MENQVVVGEAPGGGGGRGRAYHDVELSDPPLQLAHAVAPARCYSVLRPHPSLVPPAVQAHPLSRPPDRHQRLVNKQPIVPCVPLHPRQEARVVYQLLEWLPGLNDVLQVVSPDLGVVVPMDVPVPLLRLQRRDGIYRAVEHRDLLRKKGLLKQEISAEVEQKIVLLRDLWRVVRHDVAAVGFGKDVRHRRTRRRQPSGRPLRALPTHAAQ